jgi:hypothetical protein
MSNSASSQLPKPSDGSAKVESPYEAALNAAFKQLTDQILIFLLAYMILLIGISVFGQDIAAQLRTLLYIIPILGVAAYVWVRRSSLSKRTRDRSVQVRSGIATGPGTYVGGERGAVQEDAGRTTTRSGIATGGATVLGRDAPASIDKQTPQAIETQYLLQIFEGLDEANQRRLIDTAHGLLEQQKMPRPST